MLIHALTQTSPDRVTVVLEDGSQVKSALGVVAALRLFAGKDLDPGQVEELRRESIRSLARDRALEILSRRPMSRRELMGKLREKGESEDTASYCADWLESQGFLNDESYAGIVARHYAGKGYGEGRIRAELSRRGVPRDYWEEALAALPAADGKLDRFIASRLKDPADQAQIQKISAALARRGYSWEEIRTALRRYAEDITEE